MTQDQFRFQVNLAGMIDVLSNHLYSSPNVYIRELLQNATDAITARNDVEAGHKGRVFIEVNHAENCPPTIMFEDNGIGLTEPQIHEFLAMIGHSSKNVESLDEVGYIGRFGIGLLSCFMVSDEIIVITRAVGSEHAYEWKGAPDGTYSIRQLDQQITPGTRVFLRCKTGANDYFAANKVESLVTHYGCLLPYPVIVSTDGVDKTINLNRPEWLYDPSRITNRDEVLHFGSEMLGSQFIDFIPLQTPLGTTGGVAYILPYTVSLNAKRAHKVFLKNMLVSEEASNIMPDWAFFIRCVIWTNDLRPTASREDFYLNENLEITVNELGNSIRQALMSMGVTEPERLQRIINIHYLAMKSLAVDDDEFYKMIIKWLPFETTFGQLKLDGIVGDEQQLNYAKTVDEYRQIAKIATSHSMCVVNGGYVYDDQLIAKLPLINEQIQLNEVTAEDVVHTFEELGFEERNHVFAFLKLADLVLQSFKCTAEMKKFVPHEISSLYVPSQETNFMRKLQNTQEESNPVFGSVIGQFMQEVKPSSYATLCMNYHNELIQKIIQTGNAEVQQHLIKLLYIHSLLLGHHPLRKEELQLLNQGLYHLLEWGLKR